MQQTTGSKEQELPGTSTTSSAEASPASLGKFTKAFALSEQTGSVLMTAGPQRTTSLADLSASEEVVSAQPGNGAARSLERTHDLVSLHALRLRDSSDDSLRVMIRPGPGMQLSLDLHLRDGGGVEVRALLNRGDYAFLNSHWADLQHQLETRGVRLSPLSHSEQSASSQGFEHPRRRQDPNEDPASEALATLPFVNAAPAVKPRLAPLPATPGWNYWA